MFWKKYELTPSSLCCLHVSDVACRLFNLLRTDVSLQDEKFQTLTSHVWIEMVRETAVLRSGAAGSSFVHIYRLFVVIVVAAAVYLLLSVLAQRVPHMGT